MSFSHTKDSGNIYYLKIFVINLSQIDVLEVNFGKIKYFLYILKIYCTTITQTGMYM
jgi:hypothetical protein